MDSKMASPKSTSASPNEGSTKAIISTARAAADGGVKHKKSVQNSGKSSTTTANSKQNKRKSEKKASKKQNEENQYQLSAVVRSAVRCLTQLKAVKEQMGNLVSKDDQLSRGLKRIQQSSDYEQLACLAKSITILSREAFLPAHRLNQTAICLHNTEDIIRTPNNNQMYNFAENGRITIPAMSFNSVTVAKIRTCVDHATDLYNKFSCKGETAQQMQDILLLVMRAFQDLHVTAVGSYEIFKLLLYVSEEEKRSLQDFISSLPSVERIEMLVEVEDLRRTIDEIVIFLEKLSWGAYTIFCLASGRDVGADDETVPNPFNYCALELTPSGNFKHPQNVHSNSDYPTNTGTSPVVLKKSGKLKFDDIHKVSSKSKTNSYAAMAMINEVRKFNGRRSRLLKQGQKDIDKSLESGN